MSSYRFYFLDRTGRISRAEETECADDADALQRAQAAGHVHGIEVWCGRRLVGGAEGVSQRA